MPLVVVALIVVARLGARHADAATNGPLPALHTTAPADAAAHTAECTKLLTALPLTLAGLAPRRVQVDSPFVLAWGRPAVIVTCGARKPGALHPGSAAELRVVNDVPFVLDLRSNTAVYTDVDRGPFISVTFQAGRQPADYLTILTSAITRALPAVCTTDPASPSNEQCAER